VDIGGACRTPSLQLLEGHVANRPEHRPRAGEPGEVGTPGQPEVGELDLTVGVQQHVARLHVAVDEPARVNVVEPSRYRRHHRGRARRVQRTGPQGAAQRLALDVLHDDDDAIIGVEDVKDRDEVRMAERGAHLCLAPQPLQPGLAQPGVQALERDLPTQQSVVGEGHLAHAPPAQRAQLPVATQLEGGGHAEAIPGRGRPTNVVRAAGWLPCPGC